MKKYLWRLVCEYLAVVAIMTLLKGVFMICYHDIYSPFGAKQWLAALTHGLAMDFSVGGYLMIVPSLLTVVSCFLAARALNTIAKVYWIAAMGLVSLVVISDMALYGFWHFKLDATAVFYLTSSPKLAMASAEWWMILAGAVAWCILTAILSWVMIKVMKLTPLPAPALRISRRLASGGVTLLLCALLFIPIRGGVTVSTMNPGNAYFSPVEELNHAAVNPVFSVMYSLGHQHDFASQFRYYNSSDQALAAADPLLALPADTASVNALNIDRPDIYIFLLESFSNHLFKSLGGRPIANKLDSVARDSSSLIFTRFYANSFRTDRGIPSVLSGVPAPPTTSLMRHHAIVEALPNIAAELAAAGYQTRYYYGGDINFTNQLAYLRSGGFQHIVSDKDFPASRRLSKWGVHDGPMLDRVTEELPDPAMTSGRQPVFAVIQTSSSHEPFEVPMKQRHPEAPANAFIYADSCIGEWINRLSRSALSERSLVILVPDHYGAWPENLTFEERHQVPLIMTGGALALHGENATVGSQKDIAATLLAMLGIDSQAFPFSRNLLSPANRGYAFFSEPDLAGVAASDNSLTTLQLTSADLIPPSRPDSVAAAFLQLLYDYADSLSHSKVNHATRTPCKP